MTKLAILNINERTKFNAPPKFNQDERALHFSLFSENLQIVQQLRSITTKVGFILQLGYFRANGKFYTTEQFRQKDIFYVTQILGLNAEEINLSSYKNKIITQHRRKILALLGWQPFNKLQQDNTIEHVKWLVQRQMSLKHIFLSVIDFCWQNKVEVPSFDILSDIIINGYNNFEYAEQTVVETYNNIYTYFKPAGYILKMFLNPKLSNTAFKIIQRKAYKKLSNNKLVAVSKYLMEQCVDKTAYEWQYHSDNGRCIINNLRHIFMVIDFECNKHNKPLIKWGKVS